LENGAAGFELAAQALGAVDLQLEGASLEGPDGADVQVALADLAIATAAPAERRALLDELVAIQSRQPGVDSMAVAGRLQAQATDLLGQGRALEAIGLYQATLDILAARLPPEGSCAALPQFTKSDTLSGSAASKRPSSVTAEPCPTTRLSAASGESTPQVTPSMRATGSRMERALNAVVTSNSGRHMCCQAGARSFSPASYVDSSRFTSSRPIWVSPPKRPGVTARPFASMTATPAGASPAQASAPWKVGRLFSSSTRWRLA